MSLQYRIYANDGAGGPVDLSSPIAATSSLSWASGALSAPGDHSFLVRAHDTLTGLEDLNSDARVRVLLDASGADITAQPNAPSGLSAVPREGGTCRVAWVYNPGGQGGRPSGFHVYRWSGSPDYSTPVATVAYDRLSPARSYSTILTGLADGASYSVAVRAYNAAGEESNTATVAVTGMVAGPSPVVSLTALAVP